MPIREYQCESCGRRFEKIQKYSDPPIEVCPHCGGHVHKVISSPAFQFKGTGWYVTDYARKDSGGGKTGTESTDSASKDATPSSSSEKEAGSKKTESSTPETPGKPATKDS